MMPDTHLLPDQAQSRLRRAVKALAASSPSLRCAETERLTQSPVGDEEAEEILLAVLRQALQVPGVDPNGELDNGRNLIDALLGAEQPEGACAEAALLLTQAGANPLDGLVSMGRWLSPVLRPALFKLCRLAREREAAGLLPWRMPAGGTLLHLIARSIDASHEVMTTEVHSLDNNEAAPLPVAWWHLPDQQDQVPLLTLWQDHWVEMGSQHNSPTGVRLSSSPHGIATGKDGVAMGWEVIEAALQQGALPDCQTIPLDDRVALVHAFEMAKMAVPVVGQACWSHMLAERLERDTVLCEARAPRGGRL